MVDERFRSKAQLTRGAIGHINDSISRIRLLRNGVWDVSFPRDFEVSRYYTQAEHLLQSACELLSICADIWYSSKPNPSGVVRAWDFDTAGEPRELAGDELARAAKEYEDTEAVANPGGTDPDE